jgi:cell division protein FtsI (penicillin-binding protein 3)
MRPHGPMTEVWSPPLPQEASPVFLKRIQLIAAFLVVMFMGIGLRVIQVSLRPLGSAVVHRRILRASIVDRHGQQLATSLLTFSVYGHPKRILQKKETVQALAGVLKYFDQKAALKALESDKSFVWLARHLSPLEKQAVQALGIEGIDVQKDYRRFYVHDRLFCHTVGTTDCDQNGTSGLEKFFQKRLTTDDQPLRLSLDARLQYIVHKALANQMAEHHARAGNAMMIDAYTGEILAMVSLPDFSPRQAIDPQDISFFNRNVSGAYEFGSIMKIHNAAVFLHTGKGALSTVFPGIPFPVGRFRVKDYQGKNRAMSVFEGFIYSSNIVNAHMAECVGYEQQRAFYHHLGLDETMRLELLEFTRPRPPRDQSRITLITVGYGYGWAMTALHLCSSVGALVTGFRVPLTLLADPCPKRVPVVSPRVTEGIRTLMEQATIQGQAKKAASLLCRVGAKTGTSNLLDQHSRRREKENLTTCIAAFPMDQPRYILCVSLERPRASAKTYGHATAGWIAAPVIKVIVDQVAPLLDIFSKP